MEKRALGKTGLELSIIGFGGFHLIEVPKQEAAWLLNSYLDRGGNYIETAALYGEGVSERKIGEAVSHRRRDFILASKTAKRTREEARQSIEASLGHLRTDHLDVMFLHMPQTVEEARQVLGPGGALEALEQARQEGKVRFIGVTGHGKPAGLLHCAREHFFDVLMTGFNYYDRFNFPSIEGELLPLCLEKGTGVLGMKALADGYLYRNPEPGIRYTLSLPIASLVLGINRREYLEQDLKIAARFKPMSEKEKEKLYRKAPELGRYVCRQCGKCRDSDGFEPWQVFLLEGLYDRQMSDFTVPDPATYALQERLKHWFDQKSWAVEDYARGSHRVDPARSYRALNLLCPYGIDVDRKLKAAHAKLKPEEYTF